MVGMITNGNMKGKRITFGIMPNLQGKIEELLEMMVHEISVFDCDTEHIGEDGKTALSPDSFIV